MSQRSSESSMEIAKETNLTQRDVEAAQILMQLSCDISGLLKTNMQSPSKGACIVQRNRKRRKVESDNRYGKFGTERLSSLKSKKAVNRRSMSRQVELDHHCVIAQSVLENSGFSFSVTHFLSAVRTALIITSYPQSINRSQERNRISNSQGEENSLPCLTMREIVERVRLNPGDPCVLEAREPLQELVRGALNIFSSTKAPIGAKAWKALTLYSKSNKSWSWIGPVVSMPHSYIVEAVSSKTWGLPSNILLKLLISFADWLRIAQESLQKIGDLPAPPLTLMHQTIGLDERLLEVKPRKTVATISRCPEEIRDYFRKEEAVRYFVPDRAFSYTTMDGRKSTVAPLRRCSGKPSTKCREHVMLKADRPPSVTLLSLVRDAASRLPSGVGTRADVCVLARDSQYIVDDISDEQLNLSVSGALDRLHYEQDPCVKFNAERRLWFYLHGEREEDEFEHDATWSTRKRGRQQEVV